MHSFLCPLAITTLLMASLPVHADDVVFESGGAKVTLVELYSSEGCSSCPPAEAWISQFKNSPDLWKTVFPVAFHVDYWDGLGWPDRFAKPSYTQRQQNYAASLRQDSVYTPEFVTNGREWRDWFHGNQTLGAGTETSGKLSLAVKDEGGQLSATYQPSNPDSSQDYTLNVALLGANILSDVQRGENSGRQLRHDFVVLDFAAKPLSKDDHFASGPIALKSATSDPAAAIVAWVSSSDGSIIQIAGGWLKTSNSTASAAVQKASPAHLLAQIPGQAPGN